MDITLTQSGALYRSEKWCGPMASAAALSICAVRSRWPSSEWKKNAHDQRAAYRSRGQHRQQCLWQCQVPAASRTGSRFVQLPFRVRLWPSRMGGRRLRCPPAASFSRPTGRTVPFTNGYLRPSWAKYLSGRRCPYGYATHDEAGSHIGLSGQLLDTGRVWTAVPGNGVGQKVSLAVTLRRFIRAAGKRYATLARQGQPNTLERLQLRVLQLARLAMNYVWAWRVQTGLLLNDRLREMRADMREISVDSHIGATWSSPAAAGLLRT